MLQFLRSLLQHQADPQACAPSSRHVVRRPHRYAAAEHMAQARPEVDLLATVAHELRAPLAPIRTAAAMLDGPHPEAETCARAQALIERQVRHMARLIDDLLDTSRSTHGKLALMPCRVDARGLVDAAVANCQPSIDARAQRLCLLVPPGETTMHGDPVRLMQAISNLLDNASKFTPANGTITVGLFAREDEVSISVSDSGIGIAEDEFGDLFQSFAQSPRAARFRSGGLGLGIGTRARARASPRGGSERAQCGRKHG